MIGPTWLHRCALAEHGFWEAISLYNTAIIFMTTCQHSLVVLAVDALLFSDSLQTEAQAAIHCLFKKILRVIVPISVSDSV